MRRRDPERLVRFRPAVDLDQGLAVGWVEETLGDDGSPAGDEGAAGEEGGEGEEGGAGEGDGEVLVAGAVAVAGVDGGWGLGLGLVVC